IPRASCVVAALPSLRFMISSACRSGASGFRSSWERVARNSSLVRLAAVSSSRQLVITVADLLLEPLVLRQIANDAAELAFVPGAKGIAHREMQRKGRAVLALQCGIVGLQGHLIAGDDETAHAGFRIDQRAQYVAGQ